jgi:outer membrane protein assembly factor BamB
MNQRHLRLRACRSIAVAAAALLAGATADAQESVAWQVNSAHTGGTEMRLQLPLVQHWSVTLHADASYPLIAHHRVFVITAGAHDSSGTHLLALDLASGATLWDVPIPGRYSFAGHAYGDGKVYVLNSEGLLQALDETSGAVVWSTTLAGKNTFNSPPTFDHGRVYAFGGDAPAALYAVDAATGTTIWTSYTVTANHSAPAVTNSRVFVSVSAQRTYAFHQTDGSLVWQHDTGGDGGGGRTPVVDAKWGLFARDPVDPDLVYNPRTGAVLGSFVAGPPPATWGERVYALNGGVLTAHDLLHGDLWTYRATDGTLTTAPIIVSLHASIVFMGTDSGAVIALDGQTGIVQWTGHVPRGIEAPNEDDFVPLAGMGAGEGVLIVPAGKTVTAFGD